MALDEVVQQENVHHAIRLVDGLLVAGKVLQNHHRSALHRIVHNHHLLLDHRSLPIELVECSLGGLHCTQVSEGLVQVGLVHQQVI